MIAGTAMDLSVPCQLRFMPSDLVAAAGGSGEPAPFVDNSPHVAGGGELGHFVDNGDVPIQDLTPPNLQDLTPPSPVNYNPPLHIATPSFDPGLPWPDEDDKERMDFYS